MGYRTYTPEPLNARRYQAGFEAAVKAQSRWTLDWFDASWRAGWNDAQQEMNRDPRLKAKANRAAKQQQKGRS